MLGGVHYLRAVTGSSIVWLCGVHLRWLMMPHVTRCGVELGVIRVLITTLWVSLGWLLSVFYVGLVSRGKMEMGFVNNFSQNWEC